MNDKIDNLELELGSMGGMPPEEYNDVLSVTSSAQNAISIDSYSAALDSSAHCSVCGEATSLYKVHICIVNLLVDKMMEHMPMAKEQMTHNNLSKKDVFKIFCESIEDDMVAGIRASSVSKSK